jgi:cytochrome c nitrite reductase small subunit
VLNANCLYCHKNFVRELTAHRTKNDEELNCVRCHDNVGHGPSH